MVINYLFTEIAQVFWVSIKFNLIMDLPWF